MGKVKASKRMWMIMAITAVSLVAVYLLASEIAVECFIQPKLVLVGEEQMVLEAGESQYKEPGYRAKVGGRDYHDKVEIKGSVNTQVPGEYTIVYTLKNGLGNKKTECKRTVMVRDTTPPVVKLNGQDAVIITIGSGYTESGATATDNIDGDISANIRTQGSVDANRAGEYTITYLVNDAAGNEGKAVRKVIVKQRQSHSSTGTVLNPGNGKVVYLTFDDGPSANITSSVLNTLAKYNAKATFFLIGAHLDENANLVQRMVNEGHTVALHSNTHTYGQIYQSSDAFWQDIQTLSSRVESITGQIPNILRFPGGSSNTVSKKYCPGVMSQLVKQSAEKGYVYFDWNGAVGDATNKKMTANEMAQNCFDAMNKNSTPVILLHDAGDKKTTAEALEIILEKGIEQGYVFKGLTQDTPPVHHRTAN